jgi:hypothetical protein
LYRALQSFLGVDNGARISSFLRGTIEGRSVQKLFPLGETQQEKVEMSSRGYGAMAHYRALYLAIYIDVHPSAHAVFCDRVL